MRLCFLVHVDINTAVFFMKKMLRSYLHSLAIAGVLLVTTFSARASHIVGADLTYKWLGGLNYRFTVVLYGDCGPASSGAFATLPTSSPTVCIFDAATSVASISLTIDSFREVTPVCPADSLLTQCHNNTLPTPGIKAFYYHKDYTLPYYSKTWRFIYDGDNGSGAAAGRAAAITNITSGTTMELIDTLDNYAMVNSRQHNSSPVLTVLPTPFFCEPTPNCYNPGAVDLYDTSYLSEPSGDSLYFSLVAATSSPGSCTSTYTPCTYTGTAWPGTPVSPSTPLVCVAGSFSFDNNTGQLCFLASALQRGVVVYNIDEYRQDTLGEIETFAGTGAAGYSGDGGAAVSATMASPQGICEDLAGNIYFADYANNAIRRINTVGLITTIAGSGAPGYCGDGGPAIGAILNGPMGLTFDPVNNNLVFADHNNHAVRYINNPGASGIIYTAAGSGHAGFAGDTYSAIAALWDFAGPVGVATTSGYAGDGGTAASASTLLDQPTGICRDGAGNTYFADYANNVIRKVTAGGIISTIAGSTAGTPGYAGDGGAASAALLNGPMGMAIDNVGNLYFADYNNNVVRKITAGGIISTIAGNPAGTAGYAGDGSLASATTAKLDRPTSVALTGRADSIFIADQSNNVVRLVTTATGFIHTFAGSTAGTAGYSGDGGVSTSALFNGPFGLWADTTLHILYVSDQNNNRVRRISLVMGTGYMVVNNVAGNGTAGYGGDGGPAAGPASELNRPAGLYKDANGNLYIADYANNLIRKVNTCSYISTIIGDGISGESVDGATAASAKISGPSFIYGDAAYSLYFTDRTGNHLRKFAVTELNGPVGVAVDAAGANLYISEQGNSIIRKVTNYTSSGSIISTLAGSVGVPGYAESVTGTTAKFNNPYGIYLTGTTLYVADESNNKIRTVNTGTTATALVSGGASGFGGDGHLANSAAALYNSPTDVIVDAAGNILIADKGNNRIREIATSGYLYTIAGAGTAGYSGDGGNPILAWINQPTFLCKDPGTNDVYLSDYANNRVRIIYPDSLRQPTLVGAMQREMTFLVLDCTASAPGGGGVDSSAGVATRTDSTHYIVCGNSGLIDLSFKSREPGDTTNITITATGLPATASFNVVGNNSPYPVATFEINTSTGVTAPGTYTFYVSFTDDHCPLQGTKTSAITITILPVPTIKDSLVTNATCADKAVVLISPGGTGKPWTIKVSRPLPFLDTIQIFTNDSLAFYDTLSPGNDTVTIFTAAGTACNVGIPLIVPVPSHSVTGTFTNPTYCGAANGTIPIAGFGDLHNDTAVFRYNGAWQTGVPFISSSTGTDTLTGLLAGTYDSIEVVEGNCVDSSHGLVLTLTNPPFTYRTITAREATKCGFCNGIDTIFGLHPGQIDTVTYSLVGGASTQTASLITADSTLIITGLCAGSYSQIKVNTAGVCLDSSAAPTITQPGITANFDTLFHFGCSGDTVFLTNLSEPASDLTYQWFFRDGGTSFLTNPTHVYANTIGQTYTILLTVTNTKCTTSDSATFTLNNFVKSGFSYTPVPYVCQGDPVNFVNSSIGADPYTNAVPTYVWYFGDGQTSVSTNPSHIYQNTGDFKVTLVASNDVPCMDSTVQHIFIDSNSAIALQATDTVLCAGEAITFAGQFSTIGDTMTTWGFGDNSGVLNVNPVQHGYEVPGSYVVSLDVKYRACPEKSITRTVRVYASPSIYLGADQSICPGSNAITLIDQDNASNPLASWQWNTGETTSSISVVKPGSYYAVVTIDGCTASDTVQVNKDCYMEIPNVFTPNGDGTNDYFFPRQMLTRGVTSFKMDIYNRWGQQIYETTNTDGRGWDGTFNGTPQPEGVYVYMIDATFKDGQIEHHQGNITLIR
jgi:gliding motility-associated-like protein